MKTAFLFSLFLLLVSCASSNSNQHANLTLSNIKQLNLREVTSSFILEKFGTPDLKATLNDSQEAWIYLTQTQNPTTRASFIFNTPNSKLLIVNWFIRENESESNLDSLRQRYPSNRFVKSQNEMTHSKSIYKSSELPIEFIVLNRSQKVSSIRWSLENSQDVRSPSASSH